MTTEVEFWFWSVAKIFVERHGTDVPIHAAMRADQLLDQGDLDGAAVWRRIKAAIEEMQKRAPGGDEAVH